MHSPLGTSLSRATFSVALLALLGLQTCFQVDSTTTFRPDGSGEVALDLRVNRAMLESLAEMEGSEAPDVAGMSEEVTSEMREAADSTPGVRFDTAWARDGDRYRHVHGRIAFDSAEALGALTRRTGEGGIGGAARIELDGRRLRITHLPEAMEDGDDGTEQLGRLMAMQMVEGTSRYVFPAGTEISAAEPAVTRSDTAVVWEVTLAELMGQSGADSLYVAATLPEPAGLATWIVVVLAAVLVAVFVLFRRRKAA